MPKLKETTKPKGISKVHISPKTKQKEYKCSYRFVGKDGKIHQTDTPWCSTPEEALKAKKDGMLQHQLELKYLEEKKTASKKGTVRKAFEDYVEYLRIEADPMNYQEQRGGKHSVFRDARTMLNFYMPDYIANTKLSKFTSTDFAKWLTFINQQKKAVHGTDEVLSGESVRKYRGILLRFNNWLDQQGYYSDSEMAVLTELKLSRVKIKKKTVGARKDRNYPTFDEFKKITDYFKSQNLAKYENMYWYTFYTILFFTGMRVSEIVALRWSNIDFEAEGGLGVIFIDNSINQYENKNAVKKRLDNNIKFTKNSSSIRKLTIWAAYRQLLLDFKEDTMYEFNYSPEEIENAFVFPNIKARDAKDRKGYQHHNNLLRQTDKLSKLLGLPKYDNQMFRHACAYFLILDQKLEEDEVYRYFGHTDSDMLKNIYAKLNTDQNMIKTNQSLKGLITNREFVDSEVSKQHQLRLERLNVGEVQEKHISKNRITRVYNQILRAIEKKQNVYYYKKSNEDIIEIIKAEHPEIDKSIELKSEI